MQIVDGHHRDHPDPAILKQLSDLSGVIGCTVKRGILHCFCVEGSCTCMCTWHVQSKEITYARKWVIVKAAFCFAKARPRFGGSLSVPNTIKTMQASMQWSV